MHFGFFYLAAKCEVSVWLIARGKYKSDLGKYFVEIHCMRKSGWLPE